MPTTSIDEALRLGTQHQDAGRLAEAEGIYRQILSQQPGHAPTLRMLGLLAFQAGKSEAALELVGRAVAANPAAADYHSNLGVILASLKRFDEAVAAFRETMRLRPDDPEAMTNLGNVLQEQRQFDEAIELYRRALAIRWNIPQTRYNLGRALLETGVIDQAICEFRSAIALKPNYSDAYNSLGTALKQRGQLTEAIEAYRLALTLRSNFPEAYYNLGGALRQAGDKDQEIAAYRQAVALRPDYSVAYNNLGNALEEKGNADEAIRAYHQALAANANFPEAYNNLGNVLLETSKLDEAIGCYRRALELRPDYAEADNNLGNALKESGRLDEALESYRRAAVLSPEPRVAGNLLYVMHFHPDIGPREIQEAHAQWDEKFTRPLAAATRPHTNSRDPERRLRIGYVSPDLREHPVGRFMLPLMAHHDHERFEIFCYTDTQYEDAITRRLKAGADIWRLTTADTDEQLAERIRADGIDILVDLVMHLKGSRLLTFARKPAPVQVTYLAYCSTTGLKTMDYRISDPYLDPDDFDTSVYSEQTVRLPHSYWCYPEPQNSPAIGLLPARQKAQITFGCMNNYSKVSSKIFDIWRRLLSQVPDSRLVLHAHEGCHRRLARDRLGAAGVDPQRLQFNAFAPLDKYLDQYNQIDIALDPFPYGGGTTTCDSLWMGVPVVSLRGDTAVSRAGLSILSNVGHGELVAGSDEEYIRIAIELAHDLPRLQAIRSSLRQCLKESPLMRPIDFARDVESAYRQMWQTWCESTK